MVEGCGVPNGPLQSAGKIHQGPSVPFRENYIGWHKEICSPSLGLQTSFDNESIWHLQTDNLGAIPVVCKFPFPTSRRIDVAN
jgi:hypothetical protein